MKETAKLLIVLTLICVIAGSLLAAVYNATKERIAEAKRMEKLEALKEVLPPYNNQPDQETVAMDESGDLVFYVARQDSTLSGVAFETSTLEGYGDAIRIMVGLDAGGKITGVDVLEQKETPGLGAKIDTDKFKNQFRDKQAADTSWCLVTKDGGEVDAITGATISSRAVSKAIRKGLDAYREKQDMLAAGKQE